MDLLLNFPGLNTLTASYNRIRVAENTYRCPNLTHIDLSFNEISSIRDIWALSTLADLTHLSLRSNPFTTLGNDDAPFRTLKHLDLTSTLLPTPTSLDPISTIMPALVSLLTKDTPLSKQPSASLLTIARLANLQELNYSPVTPVERQNAELYYLSTITKELTNASTPAEEEQIHESHPRWSELCGIYGEPVVSRKQQQQNGFEAGTLGARVAKFVFSLSEQHTSLNHDVAGIPLDEKSSVQTPPQTNIIEIQDQNRETKTFTPRNTSRTTSFTPTKSKFLPLTTTIYRLIGIAASLFSLRPISMRLILEHDEFDPLADEDGGWSVSEDDSSDDEPPGARKNGGKRQKKGKLWVRREEELIGSTRCVGDWLPVEFGGKGAEVRLRIESKGK